MLVIDKPAGVVVHPAAGNPTGTVVNALLGRYPQLAEQLACTTSRPGIVHRLDKDTSGCLAVAKTANAQFKLSTAFAGRETRKTYLAITRGVPDTPVGRVEHPDRPPSGEPAEDGGGGAQRQTGDHQIPRGIYRYARRSGNRRTRSPDPDRPDPPDPGSPGFSRRSGAGRCRLRRRANGGCGVERQLLHAWKLCVPHPATGTPMEFTAPPPEDIRRILERIGVKTLREPADFP